MNAQREDLYAILGVQRNATPAQISRAYRILLRRYHPDTRPPEQEGSAVSDAALQRIVEAYAVLRDSQRRAAYDRQTSPRTRVQPPTTGSSIAALQDQTEPAIRAGPVHWFPP